jgi:hypothetical protein
MEPTTLWLNDEGNRNTLDATMEDKLTGELERFEIGAGNDWWMIPGGLYEEGIPVILRGWRCHRTEDDWGKWVVDVSLDGQECYQVHLDVREEHETAMEMVKVAIACLAERYTHGMNSLN